MANQNEPRKEVGYGFVFGLGLGAVFGALMGNVIIGLFVGCMIGTTWDISFRKK